MEEVDFVIIGGGTAGCVLAARLSENGKNSVCLLEAGGKDDNFFMKMPAGFMKTLFNPDVSFQIKFDPCEGTAGRQIVAAQGKVLGGSSSINGMVINRGQAADFDGWAQLGNRGWSYADVLPYFKKFERRIGPGDDRYRGREGPIPVTSNGWQHPLLDAFRAGALENGVPSNPDHNGAQQFGVSRYQNAIYKARRVSTATAYLHPAMRRPNLSVKLHAPASRVLFEGKRASGVAYVQDGVEKQVSARRAVILAAGALQSPKLLQLSGIGPEDALRAHGIDVRAHLPGVGRNLCDHFGARVVARVQNTDSLNSRVKGINLGIEAVKWFFGRQSALGNSPGMIHAFCKSDPALDNPDFYIAFMPASFKAGYVGVLDDFPGMTSGASVSRPRSRGSVEIASADPRANPVVRPNYFSNEYDQRTGVAAVRMVRLIYRSKAMASYLHSETLPSADLETDDEIMGYLLSGAGTGYHYNGTARMGPAHDAGAVVDDRLAVHGFDGLYVVDASVFPRPISANTMAGVIMTAEKTADALLGKPPLPATEF